MRATGLKRILHWLGSQDLCCFCRPLQERIKSLNSTVMSLSAQVGALQVREEELSAMLRLKVHLDAIWFDLTLFILVFLTPVIAPKLHIVSWMVLLWVF